MLVGRTAIHIAWTLGDEGRQRNRSPVAYFGKICQHGCSKQTRRKIRTGGTSCDQKPCCSSSALVQFWRWCCWAGKTSCWADQRTALTASPVRCLVPAL